MTMLFQGVSSFFFTLATPFSLLFLLVGINATRVAPTSQPDGDTTCRGDPGGRPAKARASLVEVRSRSAHLYNLCSYSPDNLAKSERQHLCIFMNRPLRRSLPKT